MEKKTTEIIYNKQQLQAIEEITENVIKGDVFTWTLMGFAGTGKTTLAKRLAEIAEEEEMTVIFIAPTNKAAEVLRKKGNPEAITAHKLLYRINEEGYFEKVWTSGTFAEEKLGGLIICDEASMLGDTLLNDLEEYAAFRDCQIVYIGDPFQLPPVGESTRTVFDNEHRSLLTQVMRQSEGSSILTWATAIRKEKRALSPNRTQGDVSVENRLSLWHDYLDSIKAGKDITMVTWKNEARVQFNMGIRKTLGYEGKTIQEGEPIMGLSNGAYLRNGETINAPKSITFLGRDKILQKIYGKEVPAVLDAEFYQYQDEGSTAYLIMVPDYMGASIPAQSLKGLEFWHGDGGFKKNLVKVTDKGKKKVTLKESVAICTYGYAITAHKSQGSQWDEVYITGIQQLNGQTITNARWLYTAVTRAKSKVHMLDRECSLKIGWDDMEKCFQEAEKAVV